MDSEKQEQEATGTVASVEIALGHLARVIEAYDDAEHHIQVKLQPEFARLGEQRLATWWHGVYDAVDDARAFLAGVSAEVNEEGWWVLRAHGDLGGRVSVNATERMTPGRIDLAITSCKGPSAAVAITRKEALALSDHLKRVAARITDDPLGSASTSSDRPAAGGGAHE